MHLTYQTVHLQNWQLRPRKLEKLIDRKLDGVGRTGLIFEGFGVDHVHAKLFPMHGTGNLDNWKEIKSNVKTTFSQYDGYISSHDGPREEDAVLSKIAQSIRE